jgi:hypothetical protein
MKMRKATFVESLVFVAAAISTLGCGSNNPVTNGTGGVTGTGGNTTVTGTGGSTTPVSGSGGSTVATATGGSSGTGGSTVATAAGGSSGTGGSTVTTATGGSSGTGGSTVTNTTYQPPCATLTTAAGLSPAKGVLCPDPADPKLCYKTCGPNSIGFKSENCTAGAYVEQSGCSFLPGVDFSCYKVPTTVDATCPTTAPQASSLCTVAPCVVCGGTTGYADSSGAAKTGYCVCPAPGAAGTSKWSCASTTAWPCPAGQGC